MAESFAAIKAALGATMPLTHPLPDAQLSLATNTLDSNIGGVLHKLEAGHWRPL